MDDNKLLKRLQKVCRKYQNNDDYVYKSCFNILSKKCDDKRKWLVVMKKLPDTITNESRSDVYDKKFAKFRANKLLVVAIINSNKPSLRHKYIVNEYATDSESDMGKKLRYKVGKVVKCDNFDMYLEEVCSGGIHYFKTLLPAFYYERVIKNGKFFEWHENGCKDTEGQFKNGKMEGLWTEWYCNRVMFSEKRYKSGALNGMSKEWHENGQFYLKGRYVDGEKDGMWKEWYDNKVERFKCSYKKGSLDGTYIERSLVGNIISERCYKNGILIKIEV